MEIHDFKKHISKGKTELVIEALLLNLKGVDSLKDVYNQIILLSSKYQLLKHDQLLNNTSHTDIELAKLNRNKNIPEEIIINYINKYEPPAKSEGFDKIINISTKENLEKIIKQNEIS